MAIMTMMVNKVYEEKWKKLDLQVSLTLNLCFTINSGQDNDDSQTTQLIYSSFKYLLFNLSNTVPILSAVQSFLLQNLRRLHCRRL